MKKNVLTLAVAGAVAASAQAQMYVNHDNTGEVLIYPFYSADNGNETYIHVVNTRDQAKAVKVRIHEAENSWEVRDFNLYLSPYDHFAFAISLDESGAGKLDTADTSCTVPAIPEGGIEFTNQLFAKETNASLERTLNGYVEIIEMGQFTITAPVTATGKGSPAYNWEHVDGVPRNCEYVVSLWSSSGQWYKDVFGGTGGSGNGVVGDSTQLSVWAGGGLYGMGIMVNPEDGAAVGYDAIAIENFVDNGPGAFLHYYPGDVKPGLFGRIEGTAKTSDSAIVAVAGAQDIYTATTRADVTKTLDSVSALMMVDEITNDYVLDEFFSGNTDWIVTFPTKRLYVKGDGDTVLDRAINPFAYEWLNGKSCDPYLITVWDREEDTPTPDIDQPPFSPYTGTPGSVPEICYEANVMTFAKAGTTAESPILGLEPSASGARIQTVVETPYTNGWARMDLDWDVIFAAVPDAAPSGANAGKGHILPMDSSGTRGDTLEGLPAVGFSVIAFGNDSVSGGSVLANYAAAHEHKYDRSVS